MSLFSVTLCCLLVGSSGVTLAVGAEDPLSATGCELKQNPAAYDHKLIKLTGFLSHGFEDFTLFTPTCSSRQDVWVEYGGTLSSGTTYCCGPSPARLRLHPFEVEGTPVPLARDERLREFDQLIRRRPDALVHATIVGRYFAGQQLGAGKERGGYGHLGCCSLLAIQEVLSVDPQNRAGLDYRAHPDQPRAGGVGCGYRDLLAEDSKAELVAGQQQAERAQNAEAFSNPRRVAEETLARLLNVNAASVVGTRLVRKSPGRLAYEWKPTGTPKQYLIEASRPYWLSLYASDPGRVAWQVIAVYETFCQ